MQPSPQTMQTSSFSVCHGRKAGQQKSVSIEKADIGFMAVPVAAGDSEITFTYHTPGLKAGALLSLSGLVLFAGYLTVAGIWNKRHPSPKAESVCCMDYSAEETAN